MIPGGGVAVSMHHGDRRPPPRQVRRTFIDAIPGWAGGACGEHMRFLRDLCGHAADAWPCTVDGGDFDEFALLDGVVADHGEAGISDADAPASGFEIGERHVAAPDHGLQVLVEHRRAGAFAAALECESKAERRQHRHGEGQHLPGQPQFGGEREDEADGKRAEADPQQEHPRYQDLETGDQRAGNDPDPGRIEQRFHGARVSSSRGPAIRSRRAQPSYSHVRDGLPTVLSNSPIPATAPVTPPASSGISTSLELSAAPIWPSASTYFWPRKNCTAWISPSAMALETTCVAFASASAARSRASASRKAASRSPWPRRISASRSPWALRISASRSPLASVTEARRRRSAVICRFIASCNSSDIR